MVEKMRKNMKTSTTIITKKSTNNHTMMKKTMTTAITKKTFLTIRVDIKTINNLIGFIDRVYPIEKEELVEILNFAAITTTRNRIIINIKLVD